MAALWAAWWDIIMAIETVITAVMAIMTVTVSLTGRLMVVRDMIMATAMITVAIAAKA